MKNKHLSYAIDFVSFMLEDLDLDKIKNIILFGSVARAESTKESDIDIFIDVLEQENEYERKIKSLKEEFYNSKFFNNYWKLKGIENEISIKVGKLNEWTELKDSIISNGITLYSKFKELPENYKHYVFITFSNIKPESRRVLLHKKLFGYNYNKKHYNGLLEKFNGVKISKGTIMLPLEHKNIFIQFFKRLKIQIKIRNVIEY